MENVIILGSGCAGLTAALYTARANLSPLVIEGRMPGGQLTTTSEVENYPGFPEGVDGFELTQRMRKQAERFGARFVTDAISSVSLLGTAKKLKSDESEYESKSLIIATGASPRLLGIPGEQEMYGGKGVTTCATCDGAFYRNMDVAVLGGGDSACEEALFLTHFASKVFLIHRRDSLRASKIMAERVAQHPKIEILWNHVVEAILPDEKGHVRGLQMTDVIAKRTRELPCKGVFIAIGHIPNSSAFKEALKMDEHGYFLTEASSQVRTHIPGVYVAGDCADAIYRQAITAAGMGCQAAIEAERYLSSLQ